MAKSKIKNKIIAIVQARCNSIRLPNKVLKNLMESQQLKFYTKD